MNDAQHIFNPMPHASGSGVVSPARPAIHVLYTDM